MAVDLLHQTCEEITGDETPLSQDSIDEYMDEIFNWTVITRDGAERLTRRFKFEDFKEAMLFSQKVNERATAQEHYPRLEIDDNFVTVQWYTRAIGGLSKNDFIMAAKTEDIFDRWLEITGEKDVVQQESEESFPASDPPGSHIIT